MSKLFTSLLTLEIDTFFLIQQASIVAIVIAVIIGAVFMIKYDHKR